jgi:molybdopterin converting factor small subunit
MSHPFTLIRRFQERVDSGHYRRIGQVAADKYREELTMVDPYERLAQVYSTKARLSDKLALIGQIVASAVGADDTLSDDDVLSVLAAWAVVDRGRY